MGSYRWESRELRCGLGVGVGDCISPAGVSMPDLIGASKPALVLGKEEVIAGSLGKLVQIPAGSAFRSFYFLQFHFTLLRLLCHMSCTMNYLAVSTVLQLNGRGLQERSP